MFLSSGNFSGGLIFFTGKCPGEVLWGRNVWGIFRGIFTGNICVEYPERIVSGERVVTAWMSGSSCRIFYVQRL